MVSFVSDVETLWIHKGVDQESKTNRNISSALHRFELLHYGLKAFAHNPLLGSGRSGYLDEMLKDPEGYLLSLGDAFLKEHIDEIEKAGQLGTKFANKIIEES